jgi:hypothetical protein
MHPTSRLYDRPRNTLGQIELSVAIIGVRLQDPGIPSQMGLGVLSFSVA